MTPPPRKNERTQTLPPELGKYIEDINYLAIRSSTTKKQQDALVQHLETLVEWLGAQPAPVQGRALASDLVGSALRHAHRQLEGHQERAAVFARVDAIGSDLRKAPHDLQQAIAAAARDMDRREGAGRAASALKVHAFLQQEPAAVRKVLGSRQPPIKVEPIGDEAPPDLDGDLVQGTQDLLAALALWAAPNDRNLSAATLLELATSAVDARVANTALVVTAHLALRSPQSFVAALGNNLARCTELALILHDDTSARMPGATTFQRALHSIGNGGVDVRHLIEDYRPDVAPDANRINHMLWRLVDRGSARTIDVLERWSASHPDVVRDALEANTSFIDAHGDEGSDMARLLASTTALRTLVTEARERRTDDLWADAQEAAVHPPQAAPVRSGTQVAMEAITRSTVEDVATVLELGSGPDSASVVQALRAQPRQARRFVNLLQDDPTFAEAARSALRRSGSATVRDALQAAHDLGPSLQEVWESIGTLARSTPGSPDEAGSARSFARLVDEVTDHGWSMLRFLAENKHESLEILCRLADGSPALDRLRSSIDDASTPLRAPSTSTIHQHNSTKEGLVRAAQMSIAHSVWYARKGLIPNRAQRLDRLIRACRAAPELVAEAVSQHRDHLREFRGLAFAPDGSQGADRRAVLAGIIADTPCLAHAAGRTSSQEQKDAAALVATYDRIVAPTPLREQPTRSPDPEAPSAPRPSPRLLHHWPDHLDAVPSQRAAAYRFNAADPGARNRARSVGDLA